MMSAQSWGVIFFFQAEDGIRDVAVTGVQTCALPIYLAQRFFQGVPLAALGQVRGLRDSERESLALRRLQDRRRPALIGGGLDAREKGVHGDLRAVERPLLDRKSVV